MVGQCAGNGGSKSRYSLIQLASKTVILHCETDGHESVGKYLNVYLVTASTPVYFFEAWSQFGMLLESVFLLLSSEIGMLHKELSMLCSI
jgi:hypothetical protein